MSVPASVTTTYSAFENPLTPKVDLSAGPKSHFFQPPLSASSSLQSSTISPKHSILISADIRGRKRARDERSYESPPSSGELHSPLPLTDERYELRPEHSACPLPPVDPRHRRRITSALRPPIPTSGYLAGTDLEESQGLSDETRVCFQPERPLPHSPSIRDGLGNAVYRFAGVAGKVWRDWSTTFRGFCAGGGQGYEMKTTNAPTSEQSRWQMVDHIESWQTAERIPGGFPQDDYIPDYMSQDHTQTPKRATKRSRHDADTTEAWVMVSTPRESSPIRLSQRRVPASAGSTRRAERGAASRRRILPASRTSGTGSPRGSVDRASSVFARPLVAKSPSSLHGSPVSADVQRHAARLKRKEAEEEAHLKRFNQQLKAMIREGKEALGTRYEVEGDENDEAIASGDIFDEGHG